MLLKNPGFTAIAVLTLALGVGANTAIFSVVNTVLLQPLAYRDPDRLFMIWESNPSRGFPRDTPSPANFVDWRDQSKSFEAMAATADASMNLTGWGEPERLQGKRASAALFQILGVSPLLGRAFLPEEDQAGATRVVLLSYGLWQRRFGADPKLVGQALTLDGQTYTVVGVMPPQFQFPSREYEFWVPMAFSSQEAGRRGSHYLGVVGRLKPGVSQEQAQSEMDTIAARLQQTYPQSNTGVGALMVPLREEVVGNIRLTLLVLLGAVGFVLLIACANVANLLLARAVARQREMAIRAALGAERVRIIRQLLTESVLLAALGGTVGLMLAYWGVSFLTTLVPNSLSQAKQVTIDARVLGFTILISLVTGVVFGLAPALQTSKPALNETLKESGRSNAGGRQNLLRGLLVITEVALALVLLIGAGLLIKSFMRLRGLDIGFRPEGLLTMRVPLPQAKYPTRQHRVAFYDEALGRIRALPGVQSASVITSVPLTVRGGSNGFLIEGRPDLVDDKIPLANYRVIDADYFRTQGIPLLAGRTFTEQDNQNSEPVVIVSQNLAQKYWPGQDPLGKRIRMGEPWITVVGVVQTVKNQLVGEPRPHLYIPYRQPHFNFFPPQDLIVRTSGDPLSLAASVRREIWAIDKDQPISNIQTMEQILSTAVEQPRFNMLLLAIFASIALILSSVGIYGVLSYSVTQRTQEIGIRLALGAQRRDILKTMVGEGMKLTLVGVVIGLGGAFALTRVLSSLVFGVSVTDLTTFVGIPLLLAGVALLASFIPARRATKVDPMVALRYE
jgi:putative ABC transport system permease protein